jgi:hypothetical protein
MGPGSLVPTLSTVSTTHHVFVWDSETNTTIDLETVLAENGVDLTGWQLPDSSDTGLYPG